MRLLCCVVAAATMVGGAAAAHSPRIDRDEWRARFVQIFKRLGSYQPPRASSETVSCSGADGTTVSFTTSATKDRQLTGPVRVKIGGQTASVPALLITTYTNQDHAIEMQAYKALSTSELFAFKAELAPTVSPQANEVATYAGMVSVNGGAEREVTCSAFRQGAGLLKPQTTPPPSNPYQTFGNFAVACSRDAAPGTPILSFEIAGGASRRLISDMTETRAPDDSETLPAFLVSQYAIKKTAALVELDDGSADANMVARLKATGVRVPTNQPAADPAIYGMWSGTYRRLDAGRELNEAVTCVAF